MGETRLVRKERAARLRRLSMAPLVPEEALKAAMQTLPPKGKKQIQKRKKRG